MPACNNAGRQGRSQAAEASTSVVSGASGVRQAMAQTEIPTQTQVPHNGQASKALAVLLTQISHSHAALVQQLAEQGSNVSARQAATAVVVGLNSAHTNLADAQSHAHGSDNVAQQHASSKADDPTGIDVGQAATHIKLLSFQQELLERIMQAKNSVMFLPSGWASYTAETVHPLHQGC